MVSLIWINFACSFGILMRILTIILLTWFIARIAPGQEAIDDRCPYKGEQIPSNRLNKIVDDFTITTTDGVTRNLYNTLDSGKTVFIDLFYTTCTWCQYYSPVIEEIYQNTGAGQGDIEFWGISNNLFDPDSVIDQYKLTHNITNPCAGPQGGGTTAHTIVIAGQNFQGWPTYCVICPNRYMYFDACYPPTLTCFGPYFEICATTVGLDETYPQVQTGDIAISPNPAAENIALKIFCNNPGQVSVVLVNLLGTQVFSSKYFLIPGYHDLTIPLGNIPGGTYFMMVERPGQRLYTQKVMILK